MSAHFHKSNHFAFVGLVVVLFGAIALAASPEKFFSGIFNLDPLPSLSVLRGRAEISSALPSPAYAPLAIVGGLLGEKVVASLQMSTDKTEQEFFELITPCIKEKLGSDFEKLQAGAITATPAMRRQAALCMASPEVAALGRKIVAERQEASALQAVKPLLPVLNFLAR